MIDNYKDKFEKYKSLLLDWNEKINLTAITDSHEIDIKHFEDSLTISNYIKDGDKEYIVESINTPEMKELFNQPNEGVYIDTIQHYKNELIEEYIDFNKLNELGIKKAIVEFLRVNTWIKKWFDIDYSKHTLKEGGYLHLPLEYKKELLSRIKIPNISVCEDFTVHYNYWKDNYNPNKNDCCNLDI